MKHMLCLTLLLTAVYGIAQEKETISIPQYVNYKYCKPKVYEAAKELVLNELVKNDPKYTLVAESFIIGPILWERLDSLEPIHEIEGGKVTFHVDKKKYNGKYIQSDADGKLIWDQIRSEFNNVPMRLRKPTYSELEYYWAVISFDIVEPLIIAEAGTRKYILDLNPKTYCLEWLDQVPTSINAFLKGLN
ncbi:MAG: hypothetical protein HYZ14_10270 [Bacteroidetes bacterium]|nr:hypothetical protein [Bacteroidota bacterium]